MNRLNPVRINYSNYSQNQDGDGLTNVFKSMFNSAAKKIASESSKKIIKSAAETAAKAAVEPIAKKTGETVANKIFKTEEEVPNKIENKIPIDKGNIIEKELKKIYNDKNIDNKDKINDKEYIKNKFNELLIYII